MLRTSSLVTLRIDRGGLLAWPRRAGVRLRVVAGTAWVTQADDMEDHFLRPGQTLTLRDGSRALIGAEADLVLRFEGDGGLFTHLLRRARMALSGRRVACIPAFAAGAA